MIKLYRNDMISHYDVAVFFVSIVRMKLGSKAISTKYQQRRQLKQKTIYGIDK